jgi:hypothetical protein
VLDVDGTYRLVCRNGELVAVDHHTNRYFLDFGNRASDCLCAHGLRIFEQGGEHCAKHQGAAAAEDMSPVKAFLVRINRHWAQFSHQNRA